MADSNNNDEEFEQRLNQIWQQGHKSMAAAFLRRAVSLDSTLAEVAAALQFDQVRDFCDSLCLRDVLRDVAGGGAPARAAQPPEVAPAPKAAKAVLPAAAKVRRKRRGAEQIQQMKDALAQMLDEEPGSLDTTQMYEMLGQKGHEVDRITLNRLLAQLEEEGLVSCLGGRPKSWRRQAGDKEGKSS